MESAESGNDQSIHEQVDRVSRGNQTIQHAYNRCCKGLGNSGNLKRRANLVKVNRGSRAATFSGEQKGDSVARLRTTPRLRPSWKSDGKPGSCLRGI
jgi:hypothetical protein